VTNKLETKRGRAKEELGKNNRAENTDAFNRMGGNDGLRKKIRGAKNKKIRLNGKGCRREEGNRTRNSRT
jgi:hypothetical protein